jgi:DHA2 family multidrug resistance protein
MKTSISVAPQQQLATPAIPWGIVVMNFLLTLSLAFPFYSSYVALPRMMVDMRANLDTMQWVLTAFAIAQTVMMPTVGWLSARFGMRQLFMLCLLCTLAGSVGSGLAWDAGSLIVFRVLQGLGSGPLAPLSTVILFDAFPPGRRGLALGMNSTNWAIGALLALPLGGYLIETLSWRAIFFCGVPWGVISLALAWHLLPQDSDARQYRLDVWGVVSLVSFLVPLLFALSQGQRLGWDTASIQLSFVVAGVSIAVFVVYELSHDHPLLDLRLLKSFPFAMACLVRFLNHIAFNAYSLLIALFLQTTLDYSPLRAGLAVLPSALAVAPASLLIGRLTDRLEARLIFLSGLGLMAAGSYLFSAVNTWTPAGWVMTLVVLLRVGSECLFSPLNYAGMQLLPAPSRRMGSGMLSLMWSVGGSIGNAITVMLLYDRRTRHQLAAGEDHYSGPGEQEHTMHEIHTLLQEEGYTADNLDAAAHGILHRYLDQEAAVAAFQDCFWLIAGVYLLTMLPALCIRAPRRQA